MLAFRCIVNYIAKCTEKGSQINGISVDRYNYYNTPVKYFNLVRGDTIGDKLPAINNEENMT